MPHRVLKGSRRGLLYLGSGDPDFRDHEPCLGSVLQGSLKRADDGKWLDVRVKMFRTGKWWDMRWGRKQLQALADTFNATAPKGDLLDWSVPQQIDHSWSSHDTVGHLRRVSLEGRWLVADVRIVDPAAIDKVERGQLCRTSIGLWTEDGQDWEIFHNAFVPFPLVPEARVEGGSPPVKTPKTQQAGAVPEPLPPAEKPTAMPDEKPAQPTRSAVADLDKDVMLALQQQVAAMAAQMQELAAKNEALEARSRESETRLRQQTIASKVEGWVLAGKTSPAMRTHEEKLVASLDDEQTALYESLKASSPTIVALGQRFGAVEATKPGDARSDEDVKRERADFLSRQPQLKAVGFGQ